MSRFVKLISLLPAVAASAPGPHPHPSGGRRIAAVPSAGRPGSVLGRLARGRRIRLMLRAGLMSLAAVGLVAGGLGTAVAVLAGRAPAESGRVAAAQPQSSVEIVHPITLYGLAGTEFAKLPLVYRARRHLPDGAREDRLTFGGFGSDKPLLELSLLRRGAPEGRDPVADLADDLGRLAAGSNETLTRIGRPTSDETRLGPVEVVDLLLWQGGSSMACLGFRGAPGGGAVLRVAGLACGSPGHPIGRPALACVIDKIDLVSAGDDAALRAVFVAAERRAGSACGATGNRGLASTDLLATSGLLALASRRVSWLDPAADLPPLRGIIEATNRQR